LSARFSAAARGAADILMVRASAAIGPATRRRDAACGSAAAARAAACAPVGAAAADRSVGAGDGDHDAAATRASRASPDLA
jgi:hypothetical protein